MKKHLWLTIMVLTCLPALALADTFVADGALTGSYNWNADRDGLVNDGSFEAGTCAAGSGWTCDSSNGFTVIQDLSAAGLWNYDGNQVAYLGGFLAGAPTVFSSVCQDIFIDGTTLSWWWMAFINTGGSQVSVTVGGDQVFLQTLVLGDHLNDYLYQEVDVSPYVTATHEVCFRYDVGGSFGDNYFLDYIELNSPIPTQEINFSTVKALY